MLLWQHQYLARVKPDYPWIYPTAFVDTATPPLVATLETWRCQGFVGIGTVVHPETVESFIQIFDEIWDRLVQHCWLVVTRFKGTSCSAWKKILSWHEFLHVAISRLGSALRVAEPITIEAAQRTLENLFALRRYHHVYVMLSRFYCATEPDMTIHTDRLGPIVSRCGRQLDRTGCSGDRSSPHV